MLLVCQIQIGRPRSTKSEVLPAQLASMSRPALKSVARLSVTFLVDNTIEWMSKLPPGFTHELPRHVPETPPDEKLGVPVLNFDNFCNFCQISIF